MSGWEGGDGCKLLTSCSSSQQRYSSRTCDPSSVLEVPTQSPLKLFELVHFLMCRSRGGVRRWGWHIQVDGAVQELPNWPGWHPFQFTCLQFDMWVHRRLICIHRISSNKFYTILALLSLGIWIWLADLLPGSNISLLQARMHFCFKGSINLYHKLLFPAFQQVELLSL